MHGDYVKRLTALSDSPERVEAQAVDRLLRPNPAFAERSEASVRQAMSAGRSELVALLEEHLVAKRLTALLKLTDGDSTSIDAILNSPFHPRKAIDLDFLDQLVARIQHLERLQSLLVTILVELIDPADRAATSSVSASSAQRRQRDRDE